MFKSLNHYFFLTLFIITFSCKENQKKPENKVENKMKSLAVLEYKIDAQLGEGAFWNHKTQEFYWIDIESKALHIYNPKTKSNRTIIAPSRIGTVVPKNENEAVVALEDGIYILNLTSGKTNLLSDIEADIPSNRFNDGKCDPSGRLWVGSMGFEMKQYDANLYMVDEHGKAELKIDSVTISNGIVWTKDKKTMYYIDTPTLNIYGYDYNDETGAISNERIAVKIDDSLGSPDGMAIDENDMLWVGMWNGNAVICFDPIKGEIVQKIEVPAHNITSCAFGGKDLDTLYITTASIDMSEEELLKYPSAGSLFKAVPGVKGVKSAFFGNNN